MLPPPPPLAGQAGTTSSSSTADKKPTSRAASSRVAAKSAASGSAAPFDDEVYEIEDDGFEVKKKEEKGKKRKRTDEDVTEVDGEEETAGGGSQGRRSAGGAARGVGPGRRKGDADLGVFDAYLNAGSDDEAAKARGRPGKQSAATLARLALNAGESDIGIRLRAIADDRAAEEAGMRELADLRRRVAQGDEEALKILTARAAAKASIRAKASGIPVAASSSSGSSSGAAPDGGPAILVVTREAPGAGRSGHEFKTHWVRAWGMQGRAGGRRGVVRSASLARRVFAKVC